MHILLVFQEGTEEESLLLPQLFSWILQFLSVSFAQEIKHACFWQKVSEVFSLGLPFILERMELKFLTWLIDKIPKMSFWLSIIGVPWTIESRHTVVEIGISKPNGCQVLGHIFFESTTSRVFKTDVKEFAISIPVRHWTKTNSWSWFY